MHAYPTLVHPTFVTQHFFFFHLGCSRSLFLSLTHTHTRTRSDTQCEITFACIHFDFERGTHWCDGRSLGLSSSRVLKSCKILFWFISVQLYSSNHISLGDISVVYELPNFFPHINFMFLDTFEILVPLTFYLQIWFCSAISFLQQDFNAKICYFIRF